MKSIVMVLMLVVLWTLPSYGQLVVGAEGTMATPFLKFADQSNIKADRSAGLLIGAPISDRFTFLMGGNIARAGGKDGDYVNATRLYLRGEFTPLVMSQRNVYIFADYGVTHNKVSFGGVEDRYSSYALGSGLGVVQDFGPISAGAGLRYELAWLKAGMNKFTAGAFATVRYLIN
jgi:hypothetical protein